MSRSNSALTIFYQATSLLPYSERLIHGFTGKNASFGGPDTPQNPRKQVLENRRELLQGWDLPPDTGWSIPEQVHGHRIGRTGDQDFCQTDGIMLTLPHQPVMLLFADCVPVILYDPVTHRGAVVHAGWKGTAQQIAKEALQTMKNAYGSRPEDVIGVIGPAIGLCCFQVSLAVAENLASAMGMTLEDFITQGFLQWDSDYPQNPRIDLKALNHHQLTSLGVTQVETMQHCTRCMTDELFSYRRGEDGRNSAYMILL
jgi:polyphenol oxidase